MIQDIKPKRVDYKLYPYDSAETEPFYILERSDGVLLKISESVNSILEIMDGEKSLKEVRDILEDQHGLLLEIEMLEEILIGYLEPHGLVNIDRDRLSQPSELIFEQQIKERTERGQTEARFSYFRAVLNENRCRMIGKPFAFLFSKWTFSVLLLLALSINIIALASEVSYEHLDIMLGSSLVAFTVVSMLVHEVGHIAASIHHKVVPKEAGVGIFFLFPVFYINLNRTWRLKRTQRAQIDAGGMYFQLLFSASLVLLNDFVFHFTSSLFLAFFTLNLVLLNLMPIARWDGYWLLSDLLGIGNLNNRAMEFVASLVGYKSKDPTRYDWRRGLNRTQRALVPIYGVSIMVFFLGMYYILFQTVTQALANGQITTVFQRITEAIIANDFSAALLEAFNLIGFVFIPIYLFVLLRGFFGVVKGLVLKRKIAKSSDTLTTCKH